MAFAMIDLYDRATCRDCFSYDDCCKQVCLEGYPQCDSHIDDNCFEDEFEINEAFQNADFLKQTFGMTDAETILKKNYEFDIQAMWREWKETNNVGIV